MAFVVGQTVKIQNNTHQKVVTGVVKKISSTGLLMTVGNVPGSVSSSTRKFYRNRDQTRYLNDGMFGEMLNDFITIDN